MRIFYVLVSGGHRNSSIFCISEPISSGWSWLPQMWIMVLKVTVVGTIPSLTIFAKVSDASLSCPAFPEVSQRVVCM